MVTIKEVAERAGVSTSTVSRALSGKIPVNDETKQKVLQAVKELNYQPNVLAQGLKDGKSRTLGLIIPNVRNLVFPAAIRGIEDTAKKHGYTVVLCNTDEDVETEKFYIDNLRRRLIDGFIFSTARPGHEHLLELKREGFPVVFLIRQMGEDVDAITVDNYNGAYDATKYMLSRGLKNIAFINGHMDIFLYQQRFEGYKKALKEAGIPFKEELVVHGIYGWEDGYKAMTDLLKKGYEIDGVFATSDPKAIGVIRAIKDFGLKVPDDISVIGFDNSDMAPLLDPPLTTVSQPFYEMGVKACERLIKIIEAKRKPKAKVEVMPCELIIRNSVK
ncbi:MAG TPA: LacI family transcriptional regulator [Thermoanaerobacterales bacterium]|nr:LacI family transcriptional regulator [Thermoanaerobacterales bacterium]